MANFTFFEVHLHDGFEFSPSSRGPFFGESEETSDDYEAELEDEYEVEIEMDEDEAESERSPAMALLFGLVLVAGIATAVRYIRGRGSDDDYDELADLDDREEVEIDA